MRVVCAWCRKVMRDGPSDLVSHGICPQCVGLFDDVKHDTTVLRQAQAVIANLTATCAELDEAQRELARLHRYCDNELKSGCPRCSQQHQTATARAECSRQEDL